MLTISNVCKKFGGLQALDGAGFALSGGEFIGLIGPNGSGKTTLINCITGMLKPDKGEIRYGGTDITGWKPHQIFHFGLGRTFQISKVFNRLSVLENLQVPAFTEGRLLLRDINARARDILEEIRLAELTALPAGKLSGGQRKLLELGMVMMTNPELILLDEPFGGIHPELKTRLEHYLLRLNEKGKTILLVSHEMTSVFRMCRRLTVLHHGRVIADGSPEAVRNDEKVIHAYLGGLDAA